MGKYKSRINPIEKETVWDKAAIYVLAFVISIVPLFLQLQEIVLSDTQKKYWTGEDTVYDVFSYVKSQLLILALVVLVIYWIIRVALKKSIPYFNLLIPMGIYTLFVIISTLTSKHLDVALTGFVDRYEGLFVTLTYILIMMTAFTLVKNEQNTTVVIFALLVSSSIISMIGISQFFGFDLLQTSIGRRLMVPKEFGDMANTLDFNFDDQKVMYTTLYNPNYIGSYSVLILPVAISLYFYYQGRSKSKTIFAFVSSLFAFILWLGGMSKAGLIGGIALFLILIFCTRRALVSHWKASIIMLLSFAIIYVGMDVYSGGLVSKEFLDTVPSTVNADVKPGTSGQDTLTKQYVKSATLKESVFTFETDTETFVMKLEGDSLGFYNGNNEVLGIAQEGSIIKFTDEKYKLYSVEIDQSVAYLSYEKAIMPFVFSENKMLFAPTSYLYFDRVQNTSSFGFENHLGFGSGRGYLWSRSIPLLKDTIILGHGPDNFAIHFPQQDIAGKINGLGYATLIVDKPHNWFLQVGINTGIISLVALLIFLGWFVIKSLKKWIKPQDNFDYYIGSAVLCAVIGYCITALANDSNVAVAPVFWILLGIGLAYIYKNNEVLMKKEAKAK